MTVEREVMQIKQRGFTENFLFMLQIKVIQKASVQTFFFFLTSTCHNLTHVN